MDNVLGGVYFGALLRVEISDVSKCRTNFPEDIKAHNFYFEIDSAETHDAKGKEVVVSTYESNINGSRYGLSGMSI